MTGISELASAARGSSTGRQPVTVRDLRAGMTIALPFREFHLPWLVLAEPVPASPDTSMIMIQRIRPGSAPGVPVSVKFFQTAVVDRLPRHYGLCSSCGGLSPCIDEWVESTLIERESASAAQIVAAAPTSAEPTSHGEVAP